MPVIDTDLVAHLLASQFPNWAGLDLRPAPLDGHDNRTFRLGDDLAVRLPSHERYAAQPALEHEWLPVLAAGRLPLAIPESLALGRPDCQFRWPWSIRRWLPGQTLAVSPTPISAKVAEQLGVFLVALHKVPTAGAPRPGPQNFYRGASPAAYDDVTQAAIAELASVIDDRRARAVWIEATDSPIEAEPVWVHGDITPSNLLGTDTTLTAVIDFGCLAVADPACDLTIAWTAFDGHARETFLGLVDPTDGTLARARGWALWKALVTLRQGRQAAEGLRLGFGWRWPVPEIIQRVLSNG
ncbi:MAG TPA: aminoglycoside phosphotransferase family protein [Acidimicrobiales bacterium]